MEIPDKILHATFKKFPRSDTTGPFGGQMEKEDLFRTEA